MPIPGDIHDLPQVMTQDNVLIRPDESLIWDMSFFTLTKIWPHGLRGQKVITDRYNHNGKM
jgi:hypothetical protein